MATKLYFKFLFYHPSGQVCRTIFEVVIIISINDLLVVLITRHNWFKHKSLFCLIPGPIGKKAAKIVRELKISENVFINILEDKFKV